jgi:cytoskeletal protein RodZ
VARRTEREIDSLPRQTRQKKKKKKKKKKNFTGFSVVVVVIVESCLFSRTGVNKPIQLG